MALRRPFPVAAFWRIDLTLFGFLSAAAAAVFFVAAIYWLSIQQTRAQDWIAHTQEVLATIATTRADVVDLQNGARGFVIGGRDEDLRLYETSRDAVRADAQRLRTQTGDNAVQQRNVAHLEGLLQPRLATAAAVVEARRTRGAEAARAIIDAGAPGQEMAQLRELLQGMSAEETRLLEIRLGEHETRLSAFWAAIAVLLLAFLATLSVVSLQQRRRQQAEHELLESERRFRLMTESVTDYAILMLDPEGNVQTWNEGARQIKGYEAGEVMGRHFSLFFPPEDREAGKPAQALAEAAAQGHWSAEGWRVRKDGSRFWASVVLTAVRDAQGRLTGYSKITRDLTERRRAQEAQQARDLSARLIAAQEEERRHIARELHDDTGQSLTLIRMHLAELVAQGGAAARVASDCIRQVEHAMAHIRGLSLRLRPPMLDDLGLGDALESVLDQQSRAAGWRSSIDVPELEERLPEEIETASFRIGQEALTNAARYSQATEVHVSLRLAQGRAELEVRDNGVGFDLARYRTPEERKKHFGLVSMAERASIAGGHLEIETAPGRGTRVRASFPLAPAARADAEREEAWRF